MTQEEFASVVLDSKLLTLDEVTDIVKYFSSVKTSPVGFSMVKRAACHPKRCCRFGSVAKSVWTNGSSVIIFSVDRNILFHGIYLFGSEYNDYSVTLIIKHLPDDTTVASTNDTFLSVKHQSEIYWGFDVILDQPVPLLKDDRYRIEAVTTGPVSFSGRDGKSPVTCSGVTFKFENRDDRSEGFKGTGISMGQMHEFIFSPSE